MTQKCVQKKKEQQCFFYLAVKVLAAMKYFFIFLWIYLIVRELKKGLKTMCEVCDQEVLLHMKNETLLSTPRLSKYMNT